jgi:Glycosyl hydrolase family 26
VIALCACVCVGTVAIWFFSKESVRSSPTVAPIRAGGSHSPCIYVGFPIHPALERAEATTGVHFTCLEEFQTAQTWAQWELPWLAKPVFGLSRWVRQVSGRQLVIATALTPVSIQEPSDPSTWERACAEGSFNGHAANLARNLVASGLGNSVIRLGLEMNDGANGGYVGRTDAERSLWTECFRQEVASMRNVPGEHFLIVWNPGSCGDQSQFSTFYPGDAFVDIVGLDYYDMWCSAPQDRANWAQLVKEPSGSETFKAFARLHHKPIAFPEWGVTRRNQPDDPSYVDGIGKIAQGKDFSFQAYFDVDRVHVVSLNMSVPRSLAAYRFWFHARQLSLASQRRHLPAADPPELTLDPVAS